MNDFVPLREVARFIWFIKQNYRANQNIVQTIPIIALCRERAGISSFSPRPEGALKLLEEMGMVKQIGTKLVLNSQCVELVESAESPLYLNEEQKEIIYEVLLSHKEIGQRIRNLFEKCKLTDEGFSAISADTIRIADAQTKWVTNLLQELDILFWDSSRFYLNKNKLKFLDSTMLRIVDMDEPTLEEILLFQKKMARMAEDFIVEWEKHRLESQGDSHLVKLVRRVSSENVNLGYDVISVDGGKNEDEDRFIEVKSSCRTSISFYWTSNEINSARKFGRNYWLYFVPKANSLPLKKPCICIIRNPINYLGKKLKYTEKSLHVWYEPPIMQSKSVLDLGEDWCGISV